jgi:hypothetical protein
MIKLGNSNRFQTFTLPLHKVKACQAKSFYLCDYSLLFNTFEPQFFLCSSERLRKFACGGVSKVSPLQTQTTGVFYLVKCSIEKVDFI